jgi:ubiquinol-cytochrome c reductase cytochrome b subunit
MVGSAEALWNWFDSRMPSVASEWRKHAAEYYAPKNFNFWYYFGSLAMLVLGIQIITGIFLTMHYKPDANLAFGSVEYIMRDVWGGWIIRYIHSTGASAFFIVVYLHMFRDCCTARTSGRANWSGSSACLIYLTLMGERSSATCCRGDRCPYGARR